MKLGQIIKYIERNIFLQNHAENEVGRLVPGLFLFLKKTLRKVKASGLQLNILRYISSIYFDSPQLGIQQNKRYKILGYRSRDMLNFDFIEKS